jgi:hypothetical protein
VAPNVSGSVRPSFFTKTVLLVVLAASPQIQSFAKTNKSNNKKNNKKHPESV